MDLTTTESPPVLILGAGVHGAAIALELVLNGVPVQLVDAFDIAAGATSKSSRLIHGGLRYLEYGDFRLVRESLEARRRNLDLAPQFVQPLRLYLPTAKRWSGLLRSGSGFFGLSRTQWGRRMAAAKRPRGYWPLRIGLWLYDHLTKLHAGLPKSSSARVGSPETPRVNPHRFRWLCAYSDAQMRYPERLVVALLAEVQQVAAEMGVPFRVSTYARVECDDGVWRIRDTLAESPAVPILPACIVNATGAWGDNTLEQLRIESPPLFGGTKGTHFMTWNDELRTALQGQAVYAEADDGRLVFVLPFGEAVLVGTTDETFAAKPETAVATEEELAYLLHLVNGVMDCRLTRDDIVLHYSGVRPLPKSDASSNAAVSRDHALVEHRAENCPVFTLVGGKLTTWREFAMQVSDRVLERLERVRRADSRLRLVLGAEDTSQRNAQGFGRGFPDSDAGRTALWQELSTEFDAPVALVAALWPLYGWRTVKILAACRGDFGSPIHGTAFTTGVVRWVIDHEWVRTLPDLIERRLMLVFARRLFRQTLVDLAECLAAAGTITSADVPRAVTAAEERLATFYGRHLAEDDL